MTHECHARATLSFASCFHEIPLKASTAQEEEAEKGRRSRKRKMAGIARRHFEQTFSIPACNDQKNSSSTPSSSSPKSQGYYYGALAFQGSHIVVDPTYAPSGGYN